MTTNDPELKLLGRYRDARPAPAVDVTGRVRETIRELPQRARRQNGWAMALSAAICAATAATIVFVAALQSGGGTESSSSIVDFVFDAHEVDVQSILH